MQTASEDFSDIPTALGAPYTYWGIGGIDPGAYQNAADRGRVDQDIPVNHSPTFAPVIQPTLDTGTQALIVAAMAWLASHELQPRQLPRKTSTCGSAGQCGGGGRPAGIPQEARLPRPWGSAFVASSPASDPPKRVRRYQKTHNTFHVDQQALYRRRLMHVLPR